MKPEPVRGQTESPARVEFQVRLSLGTKGQRRVREAQVEATLPKVVASAPKPKVVATAEPVPKVTRLPVLAHHFERLVRDGVVVVRARLRDAAERACQERRAQCSR
jgi:hypothetical protein